MIKNLKICGFKFKIVYKDTIIHDGNVCLGCCHSDDNVIEIKPKMEPQKMNEVLLHESIHAISDNQSLNLSEAQVNSLGVALVNFIAQNKPFINKILEENK